METELLLILVGAIGLMVGVAVLPLLVAKAAQTMADWAGDVDNNPRPGGFPVRFPGDMAPPLRYVVLHHVDVAEPHVDLMFETAEGSPLATWRSPSWPIERLTLLERLPDHRSAYLDYEGPVSGDRGRVRRITHGTFRFEMLSDRRWKVVTDQKLNLILTRQGETTLWFAEVGQTA